jgi:hypothetical protein
VEASRLKSGPFMAASLKARTLILPLQRYSLKKNLKIESKSIDRHKIDFEGNELAWFLA